MNKIRFTRVLNLRRENELLIRTTVKNIAQQNIGKTLVIASSETMKKTIGNKKDMLVIVHSSFSNIDQFHKFVNETKDEFDFSNLIICDPTLIRATMVESLNIKGIIMNEWLEDYDVSNVNILHDFSKLTDMVRPNTKKK